MWSRSQKQLTRSIVYGAALTIASNAVKTAVTSFSQHSVACVLGYTGAVPSPASPSNIYGVLHRTFGAVAWISEPVESSTGLSLTAAVLHYVKCAASAMASTLSSNNDKKHSQLWPPEITSFWLKNVDLFIFICVVCIANTVIAVFFTQHYIKKILFYFQMLHFWAMFICLLSIITVLTKWAQLKTCISLKDFKAKFHIFNQG